MPKNSKTSTKRSFQLVDSLRSWRRVIIRREARIHSPLRGSLERGGIGRGKPLLGFPFRIGLFFGWTMLIASLLALTSFGMIDLWKRNFSKEMVSFQPENGQTIFFKTSDGVQLAASLYQPDRPKQSVLLLPQLSSSRKDWHDFAIELFEHDQLVLAIDFRGTGDSSGTFDEFQVQDAPLLEQDIDAAVRQMKNFAPDLPVILVGSDLGANLSLKIATRDSSNIQGIALFSPGLNIRGVDISGEIKRVNQRLLIAVSQEDEYAYSSSLTLFNEVSSKDKSIKNLLKAGHGITMLKSQPKLQQDVLNWILSEQEI